MNKIVMKPADDLVFTDGTVVFIDDKTGDEKEFKQSDISKIEIVTTDKGDVEDSVFLHIYFGDDCVVVPSENEKYEDVLFDELSAMYNLDYQTLLEAEKCTENKTFNIYEKA